MEDDTQVGYGKPPMNTRFKPGQSGNPAGRPKSPRSLERDLIEVMYETVTIGEGDARETLSKQHSILRGLAAKAMEGDPKATALVIELVQRMSWTRGGIKAVLAGEP
jgi:uncharacterized protein DUF5681